MWWLIGLFVLVVVLGVALDRRRRGSGSSGNYTGEAPYSAESAAAQQQNRGSTGWGGGGS